jgi:hypothetical protein
MVEMEMEGYGRSWKVMEGDGRSWKDSDLPWAGLGWADWADWADWAGLGWLAWAGLG